MGDYVPEDPDWDKAIRCMMETIRKCPVCGTIYRVIDNVGSWNCRQRIYDPVKEQNVWIASDHLKELYRPYSSKDDVVVSICAWPYFKNRARNEAISKEPVTRDSYQGRKQIFPAVKIMRYDRDAKNKIENSVKPVETIKEH